MRDGDQADNQTIRGAAVCFGLLLNSSLSFI